MIKNGPVEHNLIVVCVCRGIDPGRGTGPQNMEWKGTLMYIHPTKFQLVIYIWAYDFVIMAFSVKSNSASNTEVRGLYCETRRELGPRYSSALRLDPRLCNGSALLCVYVCCQLCSSFQYHFIDMCCRRHINAGVVLTIWLLKLKQKWINGLWHCAMYLD